MELQTGKERPNPARKEQKPHGTLGFPCAGYSYETDQEETIPWHWHEELEIIYVKSGMLQLQIPGSVISLREGEGVVINSNILHHGAASPKCELKSLVFGSMLIAGSSESVFARKYMDPLLSNPSFRTYLLKEEGDRGLLDEVMLAFEAYSMEPDGFEFIVREKLSAVCRFLCRRFNREEDVEETALNQDHIRIRKMLDHIHRHYSSQVALADIAKAADIGERECLRCFQRMIRLPPMQYLLKYRIMQGALRLLENPLESISEISLGCGFDSPSNFSKMFKRFYNCTPRDYRRNRCGPPHTGDGREYLPSPDK